MILFYIFSPRNDKFKDHTKKHHPKLALEKGWLTETEFLEKASRPERAKKFFKPAKVQEQKMIQAAREKDALEPKQGQIVKRKPAGSLEQSRMAIIPQSPPTNREGSRNSGSVTQSPVNQIQLKFSLPPPNVPKVETVSTSIQEQTVEIYTSEKKDNIATDRTSQNHPVQSQTSILSYGLANSPGVILQPQTVTQLVAQPGVSFQQIPYSSAAPGGQIVTNPAYPILAGTSSAPEDMYRLITYTDTGSSHIQ